MKTVHMNERELINHLQNKNKHEYAKEYVSAFMHIPESHKTNYENGVITLAIHHLFNSFYGSCTKPVASLPIEIND